MSISKKREQEIKDFVNWLMVQPPKLDMVITYDFVDALNEEEAFFDNLVADTEKKINAGIIKLPDDFIRYGA